jgi:hypothetical protein
MLDPFQPTRTSHVQHYRSVVAFASIFAIGCATLAYRSLTADRNDRRVDPMQQPEHR